MNPFLTPDYEAALSDLNCGPLTSNAARELIRPVDQLAEAVRALHGMVAESEEQLKYAKAPVDKGIPMHTYRVVCEQRDHELGERQRMTHLYEIEVLRNRELERALAAQSLAPSKCECHIERNPSRMSAAALESGASAEIVGPLCAFCRANARKPPAPGATDGERLDWLEKHGSEIDRPVEHETGVKHTGLCWYPDPFEDKELFIQGENLRAAIDAAIRAERGGK